MRFLRFWDPPGMGTVEPRNPVKLPESLGLRVTGLGFKVGLGPFRVP